MALVISPNMVQTLRLMSVMDGSHFLWICVYAILIYHMPHQCDIFLEKVTLCRIKLELHLTEANNSPDRHTASCSVGLLQALLSGRTRDYCFVR
jgi:hypothetical protein